MADESRSPQNKLDLAEQYIYDQLLQQRNFMGPPAPAAVATSSSALLGLPSFAPPSIGDIPLNVGTVESDAYMEDDARFSRAKLDPVGQKIYDQLLQQREQLVKTIGEEKANELYTNASGLNQKEAIAMMASELRDTGITDIYKVKKETGTERVPIRYGTVAGPMGESEPDREGYYYQDPRTKQIVEVSPNQIKDFQPNNTSAPGYIELPKTSYINTETGEPLKTSVGRSEWGDDSGLLSDMTVAKRTYTGTGVQFTPEGAPLYFSTGFKRPSSWVRFRESFLEPAAAIAATVITQNPAVGAAIRGAQVYHDTGSFGDAAKAAALSYAGSQLMGQLQGPSFDAGSALETQLLAAPPTADLGFLDAVSPSQLAAAGTGILPGEAGIGQILANAGPDLGFLDSVSSGQLAAADSGLLPGEAGIQQILGNVGPDLGFLDSVSSGQIAGANAGLLPGEAGIDQILSNAGVGVGPDNFLGEPTLEELAQLGQSTSTVPTFDAASAAETQLQPTGGSGGTFDAASAAETQLQPPGGSGGTFDAASAAETQIELPGAGAGIGAVAALQAFAATPLGKLALSLGGSALLNKVFAEQQGGGIAGNQGWSGQIPQYTAVRERVPISDTERRPGEYGRRYFSDTTYVPLTAGEGSAETNLANIAAAKSLAQQQAQGLASLPTRAARPVYTPKYMESPVVSEIAAASLPALPIYVNEPRLTYGLPSVDERLAATNFRTPEEERLNVPSKQLAASPFTAAMPPVRAAAGGLMGLAKGRYLNGTTDGMEDKLRTTIDGEQPAALSHGEFVIPADVVSHLGNGNSQAGAKRLYEMMDRIRQARTGTKKQGKQINANKYLPV